VAQRKNSSREIQLGFCRNLMAKQEMSELGFGKEQERDACEGKGDDKQIGN